MQKFDVLVIGGGAAGIVAAISAKRAGKSVAICERMPQLGKKILASGNGRCNLFNDDLIESFYNDAARSLVKTIFLEFLKAVSTQSLSVREASPLGKAASSISFSAARENFS